MLRTPRHLRQRTLATCAVLAAAGAFVAGCATGPDAPTDLREATIDPAFTFATTQRVSVRVAVEAAALGGATMGALEILRPDGKVLYRGPVSPEAAVEVPLGLPTALDQLEVVLIAKRERVSASVAIVDHSLEHTFR